MIKNIAFDNFKCLSGNTFELNNINIFTGYNGRGKSSVMQAILMLSQSVRKDDVNSIAHLHVNGKFVKLGDFDELLTDDNDLSFKINLAIEDNGKCHDISMKYEETDDYQGVLNECIIDEENLFETSSSKPIDDGTQDESKKGELTQLPVYLYNQFWHQNVHYVAADRKGPIKFVEREETPDFYTVGADGSHTIHTLSGFPDKISPEMNISAADTSCHDLKTAVSLWINEIMHGGSVEVEGNASRNKTINPDGKKSTILKLSFGVKDNGKQYPSYHVGFGYSYILSIVVTALIAKENDIVIIENPEAHLHPEAQTRLTFLLAKLGAKGVQVFVETHSEHVLNGIRLAVLKKDFELKNDDVNIFFFDYDFNVKPLKIEPSGKIPNWPNRFFDQYQKELSEILKLGVQA